MVSPPAFIIRAATPADASVIARQGYRVIERLDWKSRGGLIMTALAMEKALPAPAMVNIR